MFINTIHDNKKILKGTLNPMSTVVSICTASMNIQNFYLLHAQCTMQSVQLNTNYFPLRH